MLQLVPFGLQMAFRPQAQLDGKRARPTRMRADVGQLVPVPRTRMSAVTLELRELWDSPRV